jgi:hypothetical protein
VTADDRPALFASASFFIISFLASLAPIRSYDYFWHLATGRWISEHHALPLSDPFAIASAHIPWINGSWLFDVALFQLYALSGHTGVAMIRALCVATLFTAILLWLARRVPLSVAASLAAVALVGAALRLGARPETAGVALLLAFLLILIELSGWWRVIAASLVTMLWINIHPSALLAPLTSALFLIGTFIDDQREGTRDRGELRSLAFTTVASSIALLVNPWGINGVLAPFRLARQVTSGAFVNAEWLPSTPQRFPLLFIAVAAGVLLMIYRRFRFAPAALIFLLLSALAIHYVRNHGFFFVALPLLLVWWLGPIVTERVSAVLRIALLTIAIGTLYIRFTHPIRLGPDPKYFPLRAVAQLKRLGYRGNFYNPDQFGGFLIWSSYPERRTLTDGRNELYSKYNEEYAEARTNSRSWNALLKRYAVDVAVDEYRREPISVIDAVSGTQRQLPPSSVLYPQRDWALVAFDDAAMIFVRRRAVSSASLASNEYRSIRPDDWRPIAPDERNAAAMELRRARLELGDSKVLRSIEERLR